MSIADLSPARPTSADRARQVGVTVCALVCAVGTLVGTGVIGTRTAESSGGALAADATHLAPAGPAFSLWSVIYLGLFAYTVAQWLPRYAGDARFRRTGWLAAASMLLNAAWLLVTQAGWLWVSVLVIAALALVLGVLVARLSALERGDVASRIVLDGTFGLYLGWVSVAVCANVAAAGAGSGWRPSAGTAETLAVVVLAVAAGLGALFARRFGGRLAVAVAMAWGLGWIAVGRFTGEPASALVGWAAVLAAVVVLLAAAARFSRRGVGRATAAPAR